MLNHLYAPYSKGGSEKATAYLAQALQRRGHQVAVITLGEGDDESVSELDGIRVYRVPLDNLFWPFDPTIRRGMLRKFLWHVLDIYNRRAARRMGRVLDAEKPDVLHTNVLTGFSPSVWYEARRRGIRVVHTLHDYGLLCGRSALYRDGNVCVKRCGECSMLSFRTRRDSEQVDHVVSVSNFVLEKHLQHDRFTGKPSSVIFNIQPEIAERELTPTFQHSSRQTLVLGYLGRISQEKGAPLLLEAMQYVSHSHWELRIAGTGEQEYVTQLQAQYRDPRIDWLGFADRDAFLASIDVLVVPSQWEEPMGYVALEAFAAGRPLICSGRGGLAEIARLGTNVRLFKADSARDLADQIEAVLVQPREELTGGFANPEDQRLCSEQYVVEAYEQALARVQPR